MAKEDSLSTAKPADTQPAPSVAQQSSPVAQAVPNTQFLMSDVKSVIRASESKDLQKATQQTQQEK
jgi:hypothetical protein